MASSVTIDVDPEKQDADLQFQDIPHDDWEPMAEPQDPQPPGKTHTFTNFPHSAADSDDEDDSEKTEFIRDKKNASFWTFEYYQQFFDVETRQVGSRILGSMLPRPGRNYLEINIRPNPDLYGPFWICTTLVFTTAVAGNLANYLQAAGQNYHWVYDFHKVTFAATAIFSYWWVIPILLFGLLWWRGNPERYTFLELICVYGYSLAVYIPISLLWVIPVAWLQWLFVVVGALLSGSALLLTVWPAVRADKKQIAIAVMVLIFLLHAALAMGFMLYFFYVPSKTSGTTTPAMANITTIAPNPHNVKMHPDQINQGALQDIHTPGASKTGQQQNAVSSENIAPHEGNARQAENSPQQSHQQAAADAKSEKTTSQETKNKPPEGAAQENGKELSQPVEGSTDKQAERLATAG